MRSAPRPPATSGTIVGSGCPPDLFDMTDSHLQGEATSRRRRLLLTVALVFAGVVAVIGLAVLFFVATTQEFEPDEAQRRALLTAVDITAAFDLDYDPALERWSGERYFDESWELSYEYEGDGLYIMSTVTGETSVDDAALTYESSWQGMRIGVQFADAPDTELRDASELFAWGDASRFGFMTSEGAPFATYLLTRKDTRVVSVIVGGVLLDDEASTRALLEPALAQERQIGLFHPGAACHHHRVLPAGI